MNDPIQQHIESLRREIQRQYDERMAAVDALAKSFGQANEVTPTPKPHATRRIASRKGSNVDKVLGVIRTEFRTIDEISEATGLPRDSVRYALYQKRAQEQTESKKVGKFSKYRVRQGVGVDPLINEDSRTKGVTDAVRQVLRESEHPLRLKEVAERVEPIASTKARNIRTAVGATLSNLVKKNEITHNEDGTYQMPQ